MTGKYLKGKIITSAEVVKIAEQKTIELTLNIGNIIGALGLIIAGLTPLLFVWLGWIAALAAIVVALIFAIIGLFKGKVWTAQSAMTLVVLYAALWLAYLIVKTKMQSALTGMLGLG